MSMATERASVMNSSIPDWAGSPPGADPAADLAVCVEAGTLVVQAQRTDYAPHSHQSEFRYDRFARHVTLPPGHRQPARVVDVEIQH